jgi:hypothetical protein
MRSQTCRRLYWAGQALLVLIGIPAGIWLCLTYQPAYYRDIISLPIVQRDKDAKLFVAQSLQLRNDIRNEPEWEAVFSDQEVNAWLSRDLVTHFADLLPPEVHDPRVLFENDRAILAFRIWISGFESVITVVARPNVPEDNTIELTLEKIRAGILPVPADNILDRIAEFARYQGVEVEWMRRDGYPVVYIRYSPSPDREDVRLDEVQIRSGQIRLAGHSDRSRGSVQTLRLPSRKVLQSKFPVWKRKVHRGDPEASIRCSVATPTS